MRMVALSNGLTPSLVADGAVPSGVPDRRDAILAEVTDPVERGREVAALGTVTVYARGDHFTLRVYPAELELGPPRGPLLCGVTREEARAPGWTAVATAEIDRTFEALGWQLADASREHLDAALALVAGRREGRNPLVRAVVVVLIAAALASALLTWATDGKF